METSKDAAFEKMEKMEKMKDKTIQVLEESFKMTKQSMKKS